MKKLISSVSPLLLMIIPVLLFVSLSLVFNNETDADEFSGNSKVKNKTELLVQAGKQSFINLLLKK